MMRIPHEEMVLVESWQELRDGDYVEVRGCDWPVEGLCKGMHAGIIGGEIFANLENPLGKWYTTSCRKILGCKPHGNPIDLRTFLAITPLVVKLKKLWVWRIKECDSVITEEKIDGHAPVY